MTMKVDENDRKFLLRAIEIAEEGILKGGGPFGAVVAKNGEKVSESYNEVVNSCDPTAHAEILAIRKACRNLDTHDLSGCIIYSSCEPCPMCLGAIYWARIDTIYYGNTRNDAKNIGFDDDFIYEELGLPLTERKIKAIPFLRNEAIISFEMWEKNNDKIEY